MSLVCNRLPRLPVPLAAMRHMLSLWQEKQRILMYQRQRHVGFRAEMTPLKKVKRFPNVIESRAYDTNTLGVPNVINKLNWNRAIVAADKLAGYPDLFPNIETLVSQLHIGDKIQNSDIDHHMMKIAEKFTVDGRNSIPIRGLVVMLTAMTASRTSIVSANQLNLAQITEMLHMVRLIHKSVINVKAQKQQHDELKLKEVEDANKIAVLVGDYMLANSSVRLSSFENIEVLESMSLTLREFVEGNFLFEQDPKGTPLPSPSTTFLDWQNNSYMCSANLLANSCMCTTLLANLDKASQDNAFDFGKWFGLAWQVSIDLQSFTDDKLRSLGALDLTSLPIILHLKNDPSILDAIIPFRDNLENVSYDKVRAIVSNGTALQEAKLIAQRYASDSMRALLQFQPSEARQALENIVAAIEDV